MGSSLSSDAKQIFVWWEVQPVFLKLVRCRQASSNPPAQVELTRRWCVRGIEETGLKGIESKAGLRYSDDLIRELNPPRIDGSFKKLLTKFLSDFALAVTSP